jgi:hypothetical protein
MLWNITLLRIPVKLVKIAEYLGIDISNLTTLEASMKAIEKIRRIIIELQLPQDWRVWAKKRRSYWDS